MDCAKSTSTRAAGELRTGDHVEGPPSTPALEEYLDRLGVALEPGWRVEINLRAVDWIRDAARRLRRGFIILIDYGHEARELYSATPLDRHADDVRRGTAAADRKRPLTRRRGSQQPGEQDITAHVDFTSIRAAAEAEGMTTIGFLDQTYFLLGSPRRPAPIRQPHSAIRNSRP